MFKRYYYVEGLTNLLGSKGQYLISNEGRILDNKGYELSSTEDDEGHKVVHCLGWDGERSYRVIDLIAIQFKCLSIPQLEYGKVIAFLIDGDKNNLHARNIGYRFKDGKLEVNGYPGYYYIPGYTAAAINKDGELLVLSSRNIRNWYITLPNVKKNIKGGYKTTTVSFRKGKTVTLSRHRAMCLVFTDYPDNADTMVVNHKDGIPGNDTLDNLEWVTRGENNLHAYVNDLKNQHMRVLVRDVRTGEVTEHFSISETARYLNLYSDESVRVRLYNSKFGQVFQDGTQVKLKSDEREWIIPEDAEAAIFAAQERRAIKTRDCKTMTVQNYESVTSFCKSFNLERSAVEWRLKNNKLNPWFGFQFMYLENTSNFPNFTKEELIASFDKYKEALRVVARNLLTHETKEFASVKQADIFAGTQSVNYNLRQGRQPVFETGWQFKFEGQEWEEIEDFNEHIYRQRNGAMALELDTGIITIADSCKELGRILHLDCKGIRASAYSHGKQIYRGYRFRLGVSNDPWPETELYARILKK